MEMLFYHSENYMTDITRTERILKN